MAVASVALHFDSLGDAYGYPEGYRDRSYFEVADRLMALADRFRLRYTIFVIGRDMEVPAHAARVRRWAREGHEIANHSYSHALDFGARGTAAIHTDVSRAHALIAEAAGAAPRGFAAPNWSSSAEHLAVLRELGYAYDASLFPSWVRFPLLANALLLSLGTGRALSLLRQKDLGVPFRGSRRAQDLSGGLTTLPMPTDRWRIACWHTLAFYLGWRRHAALMRSCLEDLEDFYYVIHPADLCGPSDLLPGRRLHFPRMGRSLEEKQGLLESALSLMSESGRRPVTLAEMARLRSGRS